METYPSKRKVKKGTRSSCLWSSKYCPVVARLGQKSRSSLCLTTVGNEGYFNLVWGPWVPWEEMMLSFISESLLMLHRADTQSPLTFAGTGRMDPHIFWGAQRITVDAVLGAFLAKIHLLAKTGFPGAWEFQLASFFSLAYIQQKWKPRNLSF